MVTIPYSVLRVINQKCITGCWLSIRGKDLINQIHLVLLVTWDTAWRQVLEYKRLPYHLVNSLRPRSNRRHFADDMFKCISLIENVSILIQISLKFVPMGPINNIPALVQIMARCRPGDKPLSEPMMDSLPTHICVTRPQCHCKWVEDLTLSSMKAQLLTKATPPLVKRLATASCRISMMTSSNGNISASLALCPGNSPATGEFPSQRPVTRSFYVFFHLRLNKRLSKQSWGWWFEMPSHPLWRHCNAQ